jgi:hypothetical protein
LSEGRETFLALGARKTASPTLNSWPFKKMKPDQKDRSFESDWKKKF